MLSDVYLLIVVDNYDIQEVVSTCPQRAYVSVVSGLTTALMYVMTIFMSTFDKSIQYFYNYYSFVKAKLFVTVCTVYQYALLVWSIMGEFIFTHCNDLTL